ncbi:hypothetical protein P8452_55299 [Trifolium repens]|nr:hypothetical protein P8452_55299 [Trifolium repens]
MTALLGQTASVGQKTDFSNENTDKRDDEIDLQERSTKKKKEGDHEYNNLSSLPKDYSDAVDMQTALPNGGSYRDTVLGTRQQAPTRGKEDEEDEEEGEAEVEEEEMDEEMDLEEERIDVEANNQVQEKECEDIPSGNSGVQTGNHQRAKNKRTNGGATNRRGDGMVDRPIKESKLATRVGSFKGRGGSQGKKGVENIVEKMGVELLENVLDNQPKANNSSNDGKKIQSDRNLMDPGPDLDPKIVERKNERRLELAPCYTAVDAILEIR